MTRWLYSLAHLGLAVALVALTACRKEDIKTKTIRVPGLTNEAGAQIIQDAFMRAPGVKDSIRSIIPHLESNTVEITYNSMVIALKNLEFIIADAGFDANDEKAHTNVVAPGPAEPGRLPEGGPVGPPAVVIPSPAP